MYQRNIYIKVFVFGCFTCSVHIFLLKYQLNSLAFQDLKIHKILLIFSFSTFGWNSSRRRMIAIVVQIKQKQNVINISRRNLEYLQSLVFTNIYSIKTKIISNLLYFWISMMLKSERILIRFCFILKWKRMIFRSLAQNNFITLTWLEFVLRDVLVRIGFCPDMKFLRRILTWRTLADLWWDRLFIFCCCLIILLFFYERKK